ncbi:hypothetical protein NMG60_11035432 [Bertholletia excelsa]
MVASGGSGSTSGRSRGRGEGGPTAGGGGSAQSLKKGPWTTAEDSILMEYVRKHGEGNWNAVQRNSGLMRCGKSCRLRWANHLRPNLKKGAFSAEEERLIIELHAKLGNKWARMASQLPGRTDNEIKNYWNTRVKRLQRAGLPIYPEDVLQDQPPQIQQRIFNPTSSSPFSPLLSPSPPSPHFPNPKFNPINFPPILNQFKLNPNFPLSLTPPILPISSSPSSIFSFPIGPPTQKLFNFSALSLVPETELPSIQSPGITAATSGTSGSGGNMFEAGNSGLLEAVLEEYKALGSDGKLKKEMEFGGEGMFAPGLGLAEEVGDDVQDSSSVHSSNFGMKEKGTLQEEFNPLIDDDLSSLLNNFPMNAPVPHWYDQASANSSNGQMSTMEDGNSQLIINQRPDNSLSPAMNMSETANTKWTLTSCCWKNLPEIC